MDEKHTHDSQNRDEDPAQRVKDALARLDVEGVASSIGKTVKDVARQFGIGKREDSPYIVYDRSNAGTAAGKTVLGTVLVLIALGFASWGILGLALLFVAPGVSVVQLLIAAGFGFWGGSRLRAGRREKELGEALLRMDEGLGERESVTVSELAQLTGMPAAKLEPLVSEAIKRGYIPEGHLTGSGGGRTLFLTDSAWEEELEARSRGEETERRQARQAEEEAAQRAALPADAVAVLDACSAFARDAESARSAIADEEVRTSLDAMVSKVQGIAAYVREHPETAPQLRKMVSYYLPTTGKLAASYAKLEGRGGEQAESMRAELKETLALVDSALAKFSEDLLREQSWDLKSDMDVMRTMIEQDGLAD